VVAGYEAFWQHYAAMSPALRFFYEILLHNQPCHLYVDVDADLTLNPDIDERHLLHTLLDECVRLLIELGAVERADQVRVVALDASKPGKLSKHYVFRLAGGGVVFRNAYHCGAFVRRLRQRVLRSYGLEVERNPFFVRKLESDRTCPGHSIEVREFLVDKGVYTRNRNFRLWRSVKETARDRPLLREGEPGDAPLCKLTFFDCLVQRTAPDARLFDCLEQDDSTPRSTTAAVVPAPAAAAPDAKKRVPASIRTADTTADAALRAHYEHVYPFQAVYELFGGHARRCTSGRCTRTGTPARGTPTWCSTAS